MKLRGTTYTRRKRNGLCVDCAGKRGRDGTTVRCRKCARLANAYDTRRRARTTEAAPRAPENMVRIRLDAGLCIACGNPDPGLFRCAKCDRKRHEARAARVSP